MANDEQIRNHVHSTIDRSFAYIEDRTSLRYKIMNEVKGERKVKKKMSLALVCALVMVVALSGIAVAAGLNMLEHFGDEREWDQPWVSERLDKVQEHAVELGKTVNLETPTGKIEPKTVKDQLATSLYGRKFELTVDEVYCNGNKLYYTYTFTHDPDKTFKGEGKPDGFADGELKKFYDKWEYEDGNGQPTFGNLEFEQEEYDWYQAHESSWFASQSCFVGDGVELADGTSLLIWDSYQEDVDENTARAYYEVELPEGYEAGETLDVVMTILYKVNVGYADETGVYWGSVGADEEFSNKVTSFMRVPLTIPVTGSVKLTKGDAEFEAYSAKAELKISEFDVSGDIVVHPAKPWKMDVENDQEVKDNYIKGYILVANGVEYEDLWGARSEPAEDGSYSIEMRFELPEKSETLSLRPVYRDGSTPENEDIILK